MNIFPVILMMLAGLVSPAVVVAEPMAIPVDLRQPKKVDSRSVTVKVQDHARVVDAIKVGNVFVVEHLNGRSYPEEPSWRKVVAPLISIPLGAPVDSKPGEYFHMLDRLEYSDVHMTLCSELSIEDITLGALKTITLRYGARRFGEYTWDPTFKFLPYPQSGRYSIEVVVNQDNKIVDFRSATKGNQGFYTYHLRPINAYVGSGGNFGETAEAMVARVAALRKGIEDIKAAAAKHCTSNSSPGS